MNDWKARAAPANTPPPPPQPLKPEPEPGVGRRLLSVTGGQPPSGGPPPSSSGRNSPANLPPPDDAAAAVARVASEFRALERLRAAGYGGSIVAEKVKEIRLAVARLPEEVRGRVVALVEDRAEEMELRSQILRKEADLAWRKAELAALKERARRAAAARAERGRVCDSCGQRHPFEGVLASRLTCRRSTAARGSRQRLARIYAQVCGFLAGPQMVGAVRFLHSLHGDRDLRQPKRDARRPYPRKV